MKIPTNKSSEGNIDENMYSMIKLKEDIGLLKILSFLLPKEQRIKIEEIRKKQIKMEKTIVAFNNFYSGLGWCAYDSMNPSLMERAVTKAESDGVETGERVLIDYYLTDVKEIVHWLRNKAEPFRQRKTLIDQAFDEHFSGRYYASVPLFLIIIDGAINDYTKSKGFFAEGTDVTAWDCLVGCSDGLTKMKRIFNTGRNKTNHEEIRFPFRNGILHGRDINYGNEYVSCKCVSLMFALADWMSMKDSEDARKEKYEKDMNSPSLDELIKKKKEISQDRGLIKQWTKRTIIIGEDIPAVPTEHDSSEHQYLIPLIRAFEAWRVKNYGDLSIYFKNMFDSDLSEKKRAGQCRHLFQRKNLISYELKEVEERTCALTRVSVQAEWEDYGNVFSEPLEFGIAYQGEIGAFPWKGNGKWIIIPWNIQGLYKQ